MNKSIFAKSVFLGALGSLISTQAGAMHANVHRGGGAHVNRSMHVNRNVNRNVPVNRNVNVNRNVRVNGYHGGVYHAGARARPYRWAPQAARLRRARRWASSPRQAPPPGPAPRQSLGSAGTTRTRANGTGSGTIASSLATKARRRNQHWSRSFPSDCRAPVANHGCPAGIPRPGNPSPGLDVRMAPEVLAGRHRALGARLRSEERRPAWQ